MWFLGLLVVFFFFGSSLFCFYLQNKISGCLRTTSEFPGRYRYAFSIVRLESKAQSWTVHIQHPLQCFMLPET